MESRKNQGKHEEKDMGEILSKAEQFFEKHQKIIYYSLIGILSVAFSRRSPLYFWQDCR